MLPNRDTNPSTPARDVAADAAVALLAETWPATSSTPKTRERTCGLFRSCGV